MPLPHATKVTATDDGMFRWDCAGCDAMSKSRNEERMQVDAQLHEDAWAGSESKVRYWADIPGQHEYQDVTDELRDILVEARDRILDAPGPPPYRLNGLISKIDGTSCMCDGGGSVPHVPARTCTSGPFVKALRKMDVPS